MCLIIHKPAGVVLDPAVLVNVHAHNQDGFGIMAVDRDKVVVAKTLQGPTTIQKLVDEFTPLECGLHWRFRTHGDISLDNVHPYKVLDRKEDGEDLYLMHNGQIDTPYGEKKGQSDTAAFVEDVLRPLLLETYINLAANSAFLDLLEMAMGGSSKLLLCSSATGFHRINSSLGTMKKDKVWYSNTYSLAPPVRISPARHYGGDEWGNGMLPYKYNAGINTPRLLPLPSAPASVSAPVSAPVSAKETKKVEVTVTDYWDDEVEDDRKSFDLWLKEHSQYQEAGPETTRSLLLAMTPSERFQWLIDNPEDASDWISENL